MKIKVPHGRKSPPLLLAVAFLLISWFFLHLAVQISCSSLFPRSLLRSTIPIPPSSSSPPLPLQIKGCSADRAKLKVYMYDLPPAFHFGMMGWEAREETWPDVTGASDGDGDIPRYPGGLTLQHSVEYWLTLDLLSSSNSSTANTRPCFAVRVEDSSLADVVFVPFFSSLSYNRYSRSGKDKRLQKELVDFLVGREEWRRWKGKDHVIVAHHPNSMKDSRRKLKEAMFVVADFGRYPREVTNVWKDVAAPYRHVVATVAGNASAPFDERPTLAYFRGTIRRKDGGLIRRKLYGVLKDEKDVRFSFGVARGGGRRRASRGMGSSKFCLSLAGDTPSSNRLFDAVASHCVPVVVSDDIELPFEDVLDYTEFCVFVPSADAVKRGFLVELLRGIGREEWTRMWERLRRISRHFEYRYPSRSGDAVQMIWEAVARKVLSASASPRLVYREKRLDVCRKDGS